MEVNQEPNIETGFYLEDGEVLVTIDVAEVTLSMTREAAKNLGLMLLETSFNAESAQKIYNNNPDPVHARENLEEFGNIISESTREIDGDN